MKWFVFVFIFAACNLDDPQPVKGKNNTVNQNNSTKNNSVKSNNSTVKCELECGHGACKNNACVCELGYKGTHCSELGCDENACSHGQCQNDICQCETEYTGANCDACAEHFQDNDGDGICKPACLEGVCGDATCVDTSGDVQCECPEGTAYNSKKCNLVVPKDPGLNQGGWTAFGGVTMEPETDGSVDAGVAMFGSGGDMCWTYSGIGQAYALGNYSDIGPLKIEISFLEDCHNARCLGGGSPALSVNNRSYQILVPENKMISSGWISKSYCLGEAYYGDTVLSIVQASSMACEFALFESVKAVDHVRFFSPSEAENDCPIPGFARNPKFDRVNEDSGTAVGWKIDRPQTGIVDVVQMEDGNNKLHLFSDKRCTASSAESTISIPDRDGLALRFKYRAKGELFSVKFANHTMRYPARAAEGETRFCVPNGTRGTVIPITFSVAGLGDNCDGGQIHEMWLDDVEIVDDSRCKTKDGFINGDFTHDGLAWEVEQTARTYFLNAVQGGRAMGVRGTRCGKLNDVSQTVFVPADASINAIEYRYLLQDASSIEAKMKMEVVDSYKLNWIKKELAETASFKTSVYCLPEALRGRAAKLSFRSEPKDTNAPCDRYSSSGFYVEYVKFVKNSKCP